MEPKAKSSQETAPGALLRQAREARGLSIDEVAQDLRLSPRVISAVEEDAYDHLPGPTYVRGYLRSYAQFLELAPQRLIDAYNNRPEAARRTDMTAPAPVRQITSSDAMVRLGTVLVAVIVFGLAALWWSGHDGDGSTPQARPVPSAGPAGGDVAVAPQPEMPSAESDARPETPAGAPESVPNALEKPAAPAPGSASSGTEENAPPAPVPPLDPNVPLSRLVLYMHADSWADVRDAQQRRLLYETIPAGRVVTVEGVAPISVFLGNVEGVTVEFDGQQYDALRHKRGEVARFTLGSPRG